MAIATNHCQTQWHVAFPDFPETRAKRDYIPYHSSTDVSEQAGAGENDGLIEKTRFRGSFHRDKQPICESDFDSRMPRCVFLLRFMECLLLLANPIRPFANRS